MNPVDLIGDTTHRVIVRAELAPLTGAGSRFQPTGFPDIGPALYSTPPTTDRPNGQRVCIVDSAASVANRLEAVCWDEAACNVFTALNGLPYVRLLRGNDSMSDFVTSSITEPHRLASSYLTEATAPNGTTLEETLHFLFGLIPTSKKKKTKKGGATSDEEVGGDFQLPAQRRDMFSAIFRFDPCSLLHGLFFPQFNQIKLPRCLYGTIEADGAETVESRGVKFDFISPEKSKDKKSNKGQPIFPRVEAIASQVRATFVLDCAQIRSFGLDATPPVCSTPSRSGRSANSYSAGCVCARPAI